MNVARTSYTLLLAAAALIALAQPHVQMAGALVMAAALMLRLTPAIGSSRSRRRPAHATPG